MCHTCLQVEHLECAGYDPKDGDVHGDWFCRDCQRAPFALRTGLEDPQPGDEIVYAYCTEVDVWEQGEHIIAQWFKIQGRSDATNRKRANAKAFAEKERAWRELPPAAQQARRRLKAKAAVAWAAAQDEEARVANELANAGVGPAIEEVGVAEGVVVPGAQHAAAEGLPAAASATGDVDFNDAWLAEVLAITGAPQALDGGAGGGELEDRQMPPGAQHAAAEGLSTAASATGGVDINDWLLAEALGVGPAIDVLHMDGAAACTDDVNKRTDAEDGQQEDRGDGSAGSEEGMLLDDVGDGANDEGRGQGENNSNAGKKKRKRGAKGKGRQERWEQEKQRRIEEGIP